MTTKTKFTVAVSLLVMTILVVAFLLRSDPAEYHFSEFAKIRTNFNDYNPSFVDQIKGIRINLDKFDFHLESLVELGAVQHMRFVFTEVPHTREASTQLYISAFTNFPNAVMFAAPHYETNAPGYGVDPYVLKVWDVPHQMELWSNFFEMNNRRK